ncbi:MAG: hypothetical protein ACR2QE_12480 [Acidimicrobiales bacterium]
MDIPTRTRELRTRATPARQMVVERFSGLPAWVVLTQLFIGFGWLRAATEKLIDPAWWRGDVLEEFVDTHGDMTVGWYEPFLDAAVLPNAVLVGVIVVVAQLVAGISLVTGRRLTVGIAVGMFLNLHFMAAGAVTPSAFYLLAQGALALWLCERAPNRASAAALRASAAGATFVAGLSIPFISTLHPAEVIEDPAVMLSFGGALAALGCVLAAGSANALGGRPHLIERRQPPR